MDKLRPDALIVQDPGAIEIIRKYFPELTLHASTQMGIHNSAGVKTAEKLGFQRVILERQITLPELELIARNSNLELEVFVHGSLCCSLSGRCLLSHWLYGESGNRGRCKQPCRRTFSRPGDPDARILSPADLNASFLLSEFQRLGIASLKIEGRLRTPDYIWKTARAYRLLLDNPNDPEAAGEAAAIFRSVPGRKPSTGFYFAKNFPTLISPEISGSFGERCAEVKKVIRSGMLVKVDTTLHLGDRLRVMPVSGGEGESFTLAAMENHLRHKIIRARKNDVVFISGRFRAAAGHEIRRIGENGFDFSRMAAGLPEFRREIPLQLDISAKYWRAEIPGISQIWQKETDFAPAEQYPLTVEKLQEIFSEGVPKGFSTGKIELHLSGSFFVPAAILKNLRRECWNFFAPLLEKHDFFPEHIPLMEKFYQESSKTTDSPADTAVIPENIFYIPPFIPENELPQWQKKISEAYRKGTRCFHATHWHAFELLQNLSGIRIHAGYPFHISNSFAVKLAARLGAASVSVTPECPEDDTVLLQKNAILPTGKETLNNVPLLVSRIPLKNGLWQESGGVIFRISNRNGLAESHSHQPPEITG